MMYSVYNKLNKAWAGVGEDWSPRFFSVELSGGLSVQLEAVEPFAPAPGSSEASQLEHRPQGPRLRHGPAHYCPLQGLPWRPLNHLPCARWLYQQAFLPHRGCSQVSQGWLFCRAAGLLWSNAQQSWRETRCSQPGPDPALDWLWSPHYKACGRTSGSFWLFPSAPDGDHKCWEAAMETGTRSPLSSSENRYRGYRNKRELTSVNSSGNKLEVLLKYLCRTLSFIRGQ